MVCTGAFRLCPYHLACLSLNSLYLHPWLKIKCDSFIFTFDIVCKTVNLNSNATEGVCCRIKTINDSSLVSCFLPFCCLHLKHHKCDNDVAKYCKSRFYKQAKKVHERHNLCVAASAYQRGFRAEVSDRVDQIVSKVNMEDKPKLSLKKNTKLYFQYKRSKRNPNILNLIQALTTPSPL